MADVTFELRDFGLNLTRDLRASVVFKPSNKVAISPDGLHIREVRVPFSEISETTGIGVAELAPTSFMRPETHYVVSIEWSEQAPQGWGELNWPLRVSTEGGELLELLTIPWPIGALAISPIPPNRTVALQGLWVDNSKEPAVLMRKVGPTSWVEVAVLGALGDPAAANLILNDTLTRAAVDSRIAGVASTIIASDPTIKASASAAVDDAIGDKSLMSAAPGVLRPDDEVVVGDKDYKPSWMRAGKDGGPSSFATEAMCLTLGFCYSPTRPTFFPPGKAFLWYVTDIASGELLDIRNEVGP